MARPSPTGDLTEFQDRSPRYEDGLNRCYDLLVSVTSKIIPSLMRTVSPSVIVPSWFFLGPLRYVTENCTFGPLGTGLKARATTWLKVSVLVETSFLRPFTMMW